MTADHNDPSPVTPDQEAHLRRDLDSVADRHVPIPDWADVVNRSTGSGGTPVVPLRRTGRGATTGNGANRFGRNPRNRFLAVAAALVLIAGVAGALALANRDTTAPPTQLATRPDTATGWYVPTDLPTGWKVTSVESFDVTLVGPGRFALWTAADESASITYASEPAEGDGYPSEGPAIEIGSGITAHALKKMDFLPGTVSWTWEQNGQFVVVTGNQVRAGDMMTTARLLAADPARSASPLDGFALTVESDRAYAERPTTNVQVSIQTDAGHELTYELDPPGEALSSLIGSIPLVRQIDGQSLPVLEASGRSSTAAVTSTFLGQWPHADVLVSTVSPVSGNQPLAATADEARTLLGSLREASTSDWRTFLKSVPGTPPPALVKAERLADLSGAPAEVAPPSGGTEPSDTAATAPATPTDPNPQPFQSGGPSSSDNRMLPSRWQPASREQLDPLDGLSFSLTLERAEVSSGGSVRARATVTNTTGSAITVGGCTRESVAAGLVPVDSATSLPLPGLTDCYRDWGQLTIPAGATIPWRVGVGDVFAFSAREPHADPDSGQMGSPLTPGSYLAVVDIPGQASTVRVAVPVTVTP